MENINLNLLEKIFKNKPVIYLTHSGDLSDVRNNIVQDINYVRPININTDLGALEVLNSSFHEIINNKSLIIECDEDGNMIIKNPFYNGPNTLIKKWDLNELVSIYCFSHSLPLEGAVEKVEKYVKNRCGSPVKLEAGVLEVAAAAWVYDRVFDAIDCFIKEGLLKLSEKEGE